MPHFIAFLRGINLGRRRVKMDELRLHFEALKFTRVTTFIASGNVIFQSKTADAKKLEKLIEDQLEKKLGYTVDTFVRTTEEVARIAAYRPFSAGDADNPTHTIHVGMFKTAPSADHARRFAACRTDVDEIRVNGTEYYWLCRIRSSDSKIWTLPEMRSLKLPTSTMRNVNTLQKLAVLYPPA